MVPNDLDTHIECTYSADYSKMYNGYTRPRKFPIKFVKLGAYQ